MVITRNSIENLKKEPLTSAENVEKKEVKENPVVEKKADIVKNPVVEKYNPLENISKETIQKLIEDPEDSSSDLIDALCVFVFGSLGDFELVQEANNLIEKRVRKIELKRQISKLQKELETLEQ